MCRVGAFLGMCGAAVIVKCLLPRDNVSNGAWHGRFRWFNWNGENAPLSPSLMAMACAMAGHEVHCMLVLTSRADSPWCTLPVVPQRRRVSLQYAFLQAVLSPTGCVVTSSKVTPTRSLPAVRRACRRSGQRGAQHPLAGRDGERFPQDGADVGGVSARVGAMGGLQAVNLRLLPVKQQGLSTLTGKKST